MAFLVTDPLAQTFVFYSAVLVLKVLFLSVLTGATRKSKKVAISTEDEKAGFGKVKYDDPDVERVRRAHLNDLENIPAFWIIGALYLTTNPYATWATFLFRVFTLARIAHTVVYAVVPIPQPARGISWFVSYVINVYMGVQVMLYYLTAM